MDPTAGARLRREDRRLLTGRGRFLDDIDDRRQLHAAFVRSPHGSAAIGSIDATAALAGTGVEAVFSAADLDVAQPQPMVWKPTDTKVLQPEWWPLARDRVACVGVPVAVVIGSDRYAVEDAVENVVVEYEPGPVVVDPLVALEEGSPLVHPELGANKCFEWSLGGGDLEAGFEKADLVLERTIRNHRIAAVPMETRGVIAEPHGRRIRLWTSTQNPHLVKTYVARQLGIDAGRLHVCTPDVGGGFGCKANAYPEETVIAWCARRLGRRIKWVESRSENLTATNHGRDQIDRVRIGAQADGRITALHLQVIADLGAYHLLFTPFIPTTTAVVASGCYAIPAVRTDVLGVFTNKYPTDAIRGAGRPEATHVIEVMIDQIAAGLDLDPLAVRRLNFIPKDDFPATVAMGVTYDSGDYEGSLDRLLEDLDLAEFRAEQARERERGVLLGVGFSTYMEASGLAPSRLAGPKGNGLELSFWESAIVRVAPDGSATVQTGICSQGQGHETTFAQIVADRIGADPDQVQVVWGDTDAVPQGMGTYGSRGIAVGGGAAAVAADRVADKAREIASELLEVDPEDIELGTAGYAVRGSPGRSVSLTEVATAAHVPDEMPDDFEPGLEATCFFDPPGFVHPFGAHAAVVKVDAETGSVELLRYVAVDDCGRRINPILVEGQIHGGIAQGIGQALYEAVEFDAQGQPQTASLLDYALPGSTEIPDISSSATETPSPMNRLGAKGAGEAGTIGATPAVLNAAIDALEPLGVDFLNMPISPQRVRAAIATANRG